MTLKELEEQFRRVELEATPHRRPDFNNIKKLVKDPALPLRGKLMFIEEHNTGYDGFLERWLFALPAKEGNDIHFFADMLPGMVG